MTYTCNNSLLVGHNSTGCYLKFDVGVKGSKNQVDVKGTNLAIFKTLNMKDFSGNQIEESIYLPNENYYACEPLPTDWIRVIEQQNETVMNYKSQHSPYGRKKISVFSFTPSSRQSKVGRFSSKEHIANLKIQLKPALE